jgi:uncharacterized phage protein gp47/JayE
MAGVSSTGFETKTVAEIIQEISDRAKTSEYFGQEFPVTPDSTFGVLNGVISASIADIWNLAQAIADTQNRDTSEGVYLDYLAALVDLERLEDTGSTGQLLYESLQGVTIPQGALAEDDDGNQVATDVALVINKTECFKVKMSVPNVLNNTAYDVIVNNTTYSYTSDADATRNEILTGLESAITAEPGVTPSVVGDNLFITNDVSLNTLSVVSSSNTIVSTIFSLVPATAVITGPTPFPADTITTSLYYTGFGGVQSLTNPTSFTVGTDAETDEELRTRMATKGQVAGTATKPSIEAALKAIDGVSGALVMENITLVTDGDGVPGKAYETFVTGGDEDDIASVIWSTKPGGIETYGDITKIVVDANGDNQTVKFSRPTDLYAHMRITYSLNAEESFPADGEDSMKTAVVDFGNALDSGEDFEPTKFYAPLYTIPGIYITNIEIDTTPNPGDAPTFGTARIAIEQTEALHFDVSRITVTV